MPSFTTLTALLSLSAFALAKTDLSGCTSSNTIAYGGASVIWYVPGTGEICAPLDCGGGRAPPISSVPGCAAYTGTETYSPSYLSNWGSATATDLATSLATASSWASASSTWSTIPSSTAAAITTALSTPAAPVITSLSTSYATGYTSSPVAAGNGTALSGSAKPSATPSTVASNDGIALKLGNEMLALGIAVVAGVVFA